MTGPTVVPRRVLGTHPGGVSKDRGGGGPRTEWDRDLVDLVSTLLPRKGKTKPGPVVVSTVRVGGSLLRPRRLEREQSQTPGPVVEGGVYTISSKVLPGSRCVRFSHVPPWDLSTPTTLKGGGSDSKWVCLCAHDVTYDPTSDHGEFV